MINTDLILRPNASDALTEPARYFAFRPEYSTGGDHFYSDLAWMLSDTVAVSADVTHSLETDRAALWHAGSVLTHTPRLSTHVEYESIDAVNSSLLSAGLTYQLTSKYHLGLNHRWDLERHDTRRSEIILERKMPRWTMVVVASVDDIDSEQSFGVVLIPDGVRSSERLGQFER